MKKKSTQQILAILIIFAVAIFVTLANLGVKKQLIGDDAGVGYHFTQTLFAITSSMWNTYTFPGLSNVIGSIALIINSGIFVLNKLGIQPILVDRLMYFLCYFIPGLGMYLLSSFMTDSVSKLQNTKFQFGLLIGSIYYMLNNYSMFLFSFPPTSYAVSYILLPWIFLFYLKDYHISDNLWKKIFFSLFFLIFLSGNPSNTISILVLLLIYELFFRRKNKIYNNWKRFLPTIILILLITSYIYLPILSNQANPYTNVINNLNIASMSYNSTTTSISNLIRGIGQSSQEDYVFYSFLSNKIIIFFNYLILIFSLLILLKKKLHHLEIYLLLVYILSIFFAKAGHNPFASINTWIYVNIPLFQMYRANYYKFEYFAIFALSILLALSITKVYLFITFKLHVKTIGKCLIVAIPLSIVVISAWPFFSGKVMRNIHKTEIPIEYMQINRFLATKKLDFSILSLPQFSSGMTLDWEHGNYYGGDAHPDMFLLGKPVWSNGWFLPDFKISNELKDYVPILMESNIKYILLHKDIPEKYSFEVNINATVFGQTNYKSLNFQIQQDKNFKQILDTRYFKFFELKQNMFKPILYTQSTLGENGKKTTLEFKQVNQSKYKIRIHGASNQIRLIFNNSFHRQWRIYLAKYNFSSNFNDQFLKNYKIINKNIDDQASLKDIKKFISNGYISTLGTDKNNINFVSKDYYNTIQNDNLPSGFFLETLFMNTIKVSNHVKINSYANAWDLNTKSICSVPGYCVKNSDGTYDLEIIVEFWPQILFEIGLIISITSLCLSISYAYIKYKRNVKYVK